MLPIHINPSYEGISIRPVSLNRDIQDLIEVIKKDVFHSLWAQQPDAKLIKNLYGPLLHMPDNNVYILSYFEDTLFVLELMPMDMANDYNFPEESHDYSIDVKLGLNNKLPIDSPPAIHAIQALQASLESFFSLCPDTYKVVFRVAYSEPGSLIRNILEKAGFVLVKEEAAPEPVALYTRSR